MSNSKEVQRELPKPSQSSEKPYTEFHGLPPELKRMVWQIVLDDVPPRRLDFDQLLMCAWEHHHTDLRTINSHLPPILSRVCHMSRSVATRRASSCLLTWRVRSTTRPVRVWFDWRKDLVDIDGLLPGDSPAHWCMDGELRRLLGDAEQVMTGKLVPLRIEEDETEKEARKECIHLLGKVTLFRSLETIYLVKDTTTLPTRPEQLWQRPSSTFLFAAHRRLPRRRS